MFKFFSVSCVSNMIGLGCSLAMGCILSNGLSTINCQQECYILRGKFRPVFSDGCFARHDCIPCTLGTKRSSECRCTKLLSETGKQGFPTFSQDAYSCDRYVQRNGNGVKYVHCIIRWKGMISFDGMLPRVNVRRVRKFP